MKTRRRRGRKKSGNSLGRRRTVSDCRSLELALLAAPRVDPPSARSPQIKSQRANSFRVWWTTRISCGWFNTTSLRRSKTSWRRRSTERKRPSARSLTHSSIRLFLSVSFYLWTHFVSLFLSLYTEMKYSSNRVDLNLFKLQFLSTKLKHRNMFNIKTELLQWRKVFWFKREELEKQVKTAATANWLTSEITLAKANFPSYFWWNVVFNSPTYQFLTLLH